MKIYVDGAAIIQEGRYGTLHDGIQELELGELYHLENLKNQFSKKPSRLGRFDSYTKMGCAAVGLALSDAGIDPRNKNVRSGLILASQYGSFSTDIDYYQTVRSGGQYASPNLFSYTLPNIVIGECANLFGLIGPTYCLDGESGRAMQALHQAFMYLETNIVEAMLVGWLEAPPSSAPPLDGVGAAVLYFSKNESKDSRHLELESDSVRGLVLLNGEEVKSIDELLQVLKLPLISN